MFTGLVAPFWAGDLKVRLPFLGWHRDSGGGGRGHNGAGGWNGVGKKGTGEPVGIPAWGGGRDKIEPLGWILTHVPNPGSTDLAIQSWAAKNWQRSFE